MALNKVYSPWRGRGRPELFKGISPAGWERSDGRRGGGESATGVVDLVLPPAVGGEYTIYMQCDGGARAWPLNHYNYIVNLAASRPSVPTPLPLYPSIPCTLSHTYIHRRTNNILTLTIPFIILHCIRPLCSLLYVIALQKKRDGNIIFFSPNMFFFCLYVLRVVTRNSE